MDVTAFSEFKTGRLVPINFHGKADHAFIPNPLPPSSVSNDQHWHLLLEAHKKLERLNSMARELPDLNLLLRPLQRREALTSNSLEGTFVTPQELLLFEAHDRSAKGEGSQRDDWREVYAYDRALTRGCQWIQEGQNIDNECIQKLHLLLLNVSARGREKDPGRFRKNQVVVGSDRRYVPPPPDELQAALPNFESFMTSQPSDIDPLIAAYVAHYQFEALHPFQDGNGRLGRLILSLSIYKWGGLHSPCLYMSEFFEKHRREYIAHLFRISTHGEWKDWIDFCLRGTVEQASASINRCEALKALRKKYETQLGTSSGKAILLLDDLFKSPFITVVDVKNKFNVSYRPAKNWLERLAAENILVPMQNQYPRTFVAHEVFNAAYGD